MFEWFATAVASANAAKEISQSLMTLRDEEMIRSRVFDLTSSLMELQQQLMQAQLEQMDLVKRVGELESQLHQAKKVDDLNDRYELRRFEATGHVAYALKAEYVGSEPEHYLCSRCFENGKRITLRGQNQLKCPECTTITYRERMQNLRITRG